MNSERINQIIKLVKSQTNYTTEEISDMLKKNNYDYLGIIRNYMGITKETSAYEKYNSINDNSSVNQKIYSNIRNFMDNNVRQYEARKKVASLINDNNKQKDDIIINEIIN